ncbi:unnamed protein product [Dicrocoelium dendriticum]|nr:unnamed protein product [Dicrocoelium dendriticum]
MSDEWNCVQDEVFRRKLLTTKRRQFELVIRSEAVRELYHSVVESIIQLYKDNRNDLASWEHFRTAADRLTEMHKFLKLTVAKVYELGTAEGAANYSHEFFEKLCDLRTHLHGTDIPFEYLRDYLSQSDDPPPKPLRRRKRIATRPSRTTRSWVDSVDVAVSSTTQSECGFFTKLFDPGCSSAQSVSEDTDCATVKRQCTARSSPSSNSSCSSACYQHDTDPYLSEDSACSQSACICGHCSPDTSSSTNDEDEGCHPQQSDSHTPTGLSY